MPERTRILLVRHGQPFGNIEVRFGGHTPTPLSELGRTQAEATGLPCYSSPSGRCPAFGSV